jgi:hypothetical protein
MSGKNVSEIDSTHCLNVVSLCLGNNVGHIIEEVLESAKKQNKCRPHFIRV